jgi:23S rRNA (uridine2552-2'-O)-methyltransferase
LTGKKTNNKYVSDHYARQAKKDDFPARSVYKLKEIQQKLQIIKPGDKVLDLGCAPGSWAKFAGELTGNQGLVIGIDLKPVFERFPSHVRVMTGDVIALSEMDVEGLSFAIGKGFHAVLSDMAPATTGRKDVDAARSYYLCQAAFTIAQKILEPGGSFVCKIFQGEDFNGFISEVAKGFERHKIFKPQSCRKESKEIYIIALGKK